MSFKTYAGALLAGAALMFSACDQARPDGNAGAPAQASASSTTTPLAGMDGDVPFVAGQVIVRFRPGAARSEIAEAHRARPKQNLRLDRTVLLEVPVGEEVETARQLARNPNVEFAEPDYMLSVIPCETGDCDDPQAFFFGRKWDLHNPGFILNNDVQRAGRRDDRQGRGGHGVARSV